jgi:hypothetical protein
MALSAPHADACKPHGPPFPQAPRHAVADRLLRALFLTMDNAGTAVHPMTSRLPMLVGTYLQGWQIIPHLVRKGTCWRNVVSIEHVIAWLGHFAM